MKSNWVNRPKNVFQDINFINRINGKYFKLQIDLN